MPQNPTQVYPGVNNGVAKPQAMDAQGVQVVAVGGLNTAQNLTAAAVIKASPGRLARIVIINAGTTGGGFVINNATTTTGGAITAANQVLNLPYNATNCYAGSVINLDIPCNSGIVLSAVPTGGSPQIVVTYN
jgi:uncharacterized membrane protein